jgi:AcrR family transcriptional regulator
MTAPPPDALRRPGRPRDVRAAGAILEASVAVLADKGPSGFTVDEVAARAGCGKATIYRRWPSRADLLVETAHHMGLEPPASDTGSLREDLVSVLAALGTKMRDTPTGRILPGIIAEASVDARMKQVLAGFIDDRRRRPREMVERGIRRGELPADTDVDLLLDLMGGTVIYRELIACQPTDEPTVRALVDVVLAGFGATPAEPAAERP